jgi:hypothetical protein
MLRGLDLGSLILRKEQDRFRYGLHVQLIPLGRVISDSLLSCYTDTLHPVFFAPSLGL